MKRLFSMLLSLLLLGGMLPRDTFTARAAEYPPRELTEEENVRLRAALFEADIEDLRRAMDLGLVTSRELTEFYLGRIEELNKAHKCFITLCPDALEQAEARDREMAEGGERGALFGIPIVVKDNIDVAGYPTTNGHKLKEPTAAEKSAVIVERLLTEGAVIIGKTNMSTDAQDAWTSRSAAVGETKNAYSVYLSAGGSSGGSAVAVSLNFAAAGLGTDTNSSLRIPAALAGCVALRVTTGLIDREGITTLNSRRDVPGAITRTVEDQAVLLDAMTGGTYRENLNGNVLEGMRIGILEQLSTPVPGVEQRTEGNISAEVMAAFDNAVAELTACGAEVVSVSMPRFFTLSQATFPKGGYQYIPDFTAAFEAFLKENELSAVIFPTYLSEPLRTGTDADGVSWSVYDQPFLNNCRPLSPSAAIPEISVPIGQHSLGAGIGMEIAAAQGSEQLLLDIAYSYTLRYDHRALPESVAEGCGEDLGEFIAYYEQSLIPPEPEEEPVEIPEAPEEGNAQDAPLTAPPEDVGESADNGDDPGEEEKGRGLPWIIAVLPVALILAENMPAPRRRRKTAAGKREA